MAKKPPLCVSCKTKERYKGEDYRGKQCEACKKKTDEILRHDCELLKMVATVLFGLLIIAIETIAYFYFKPHV